MTRMHDQNQDGTELTSFYVDHDPDAFGIDCSKGGMTRQEFADECDINILMATYEKTGVLNHYNMMEPQFLDLADGVPDLQTALLVVEESTRSFMTLPAAARREFDNDPVKFVQYVQDAQSDDTKLNRLREWKLARPAPIEEPPQKVEIVNPAPPPAAK